MLERKARRATRFINLLPVTEDRRRPRGNLKPDGDIAGSLKLMPKKVEENRWLLPSSQNGEGFLVFEVKLRIRRPWFLMLLLKTT